MNNSSAAIRAYEHQPIPISERATATTLSGAEVARLTALARERPGFCVREYSSVRFSQYCGLVNLGDRMLEILPKTDTRTSHAASRGLLIQLLRAAGAVPTYRDETADHHLQSGPLLEVFISAFFDAVLAVIKQGLLRRYQERADDLPVLRGRLEARQFTRLANRPDLLACRFDELTADNIWNRLIRRGLQLCRPWITTVELERLWVDLMMAFDDVSDEALDAGHADRLPFDRQAMRYREALQWVRWILRLLAPSLRSGESRAPGLLFDMNVVFQEAVVRTLARRAVGTQVLRQHFGHLATIAGAGSRALRLRPDVVLRDHGQIVAIGDTKWKLIQPQAGGYLMPSPQDVYQVLAYALAFKCNNLALIYPWYSGLEDSLDTVFTVRAAAGHDVRINVICLNLGLNFLRARHRLDAAWEDVL